MDRLILWDIDGTLVHSAGAGAAVFLSAIERCLGVSAEGHGVRMSGKTDPQIAREILGAVAATTSLRGPALDDAVARVLDGIESDLAASADRIRRDGSVLPGVTDLLAILHDDPAVLQSLLTGNVVANAKVKLGAFDLAGYFDWDVGAFGSDHHDRLELVPMAMAKAAARHGRTFAPNEVWIIGDTPRDLACARAGGAHCLLVATAGFRTAELEEAVADGASRTAPRREVVMLDLSDTASVLALLQS
ncbi:MAG: haloacid dehalogenase-like hydrolase [Acidimicrobiales bacterium]